MDELQLVLPVEGPLGESELPIFDNKITSRYEFFTDCQRQLLQFLSRTNILISLFIFHRIGPYRLIAHGVIAMILLLAINST